MKAMTKRLSPGEENFALQCQAYGLTPEREWRIAGDRRFLWDFAWPDRKIAFEVDGGNWNGGHSRGKTYEKFCEKINIANELGWVVYRATTAQVNSRYAIDLMRRVLA